MTIEELFNLALQKQKDGNSADAQSLYRQILSQNPDYAPAHANLGIILHAAGNLPGSTAAFRRVAELLPNDAAAQHNLALALYHDHHLDEAESACRRAIALHPDLADAHLTLSLILFLRGDLPGAWPQYEWRFKAREHRLPPERFRSPYWAGEDLHGQTILLHTEQGLGDAIQFVRYAPLVAARGGRVLLYCHRALFRLLRTASSVAEVVPWDQPVSGFDVHCPLLSLPRVFNTSLTTIPAPTPYLFPDPAQAASWQSRLKSQPGLKVGLAWAGSPTHTADQLRSIPPAAFAPLAHLPNVRLISLQKDQPAAPQLPLLDWTSELTDLADTAALIGSLDLVVTVDTAVAHLAGALGKPVWLLLQFTSDWRWMLDRDDSPWYPTMRLFRQKTSGDWNAPLAQITEALKCL
jgi:hypothetical protein